MGGGVRRIVIIGGGIAGLSAAWHLARKRVGNDALRMSNVWEMSEANDVSLLRGILTATEDNRQTHAEIDEFLHGWFDGFAVVPRRCCLARV